MMGSVHREQCSGCGYLRDLEEFDLCGLKLERYSGSGRSPLPLCRKCREVGVPRADPVGLAGVSRRERKALLALLEGESLLQAATRARISPKRLREALNGRDASPVRAVWRAMLEQEGLTLDQITQRVRMAQHAMEPRWNPKTESWDFFPDNKTRMRSLELLVRAHDLMPRAKKVEAEPRTQVVIQTNIGRIDVVEEKEAAIEAEFKVEESAGPIPEASD